MSLRLDKSITRGDRLWFVGFIHGFKTFEVVIFDANEEFKFFGDITYPHNMACAISLSWKDNKIALDLAEMSSGGWFSTHRWVEGEIIFNGRKFGTCKMQNSSDENAPLISLRTDDLRAAAWKIEPRKVISPLSVSGFRDFDLYYADSNSIVELAPMPSNRSGHAGRVVGLSLQKTEVVEIRDIYHFVALFAAIIEIHVRPYYMSV